ncbi:MAG: hypothetical protein JWQ84_1760 [Mucilaginibacter sp.]|nr:hypothetical protein [Mucilaginibacter sp.]
MTKNYSCLFSLLTLIIGCKKPYNPVVTATNYNYLVIEGLINTGQDSTIIKLSRTVTVDVQTTLNPELSARVSVENNQGNVYLLKEMGKGLYAIPALNLDTLHKYRLRVKTSDGKEYLSDFVKAKDSPPIDSIQHQFTGTAENIFSYTHDPTNNTRYYRWEFQETYLYYSPIQTQFVYKNGSIIPETPDDEINVCYISDNSSDIILNSTAKLKQDVIDKNPITQVSVTLDKLRVRYSISVKQYALTPDAYNYYQSLKKNTETLGSIFDALPSGATTNIHCITNPTEPVLGYVTAGTISQRRIFIDRAEIPVSNVGVDYSYCGTAYESYKVQEYPLPYNIIQGDVTPTDSVIKAAGKTRKDSVFTVYYADPGCTNCTLKGSNKKPLFWK